MWQKVIVLESRHGVIADEGWRVCQSSTGHAMEQPDHTNQRTNSNGNSKYWNICTVSKFHPKQDWKSTTIEVLDVEARQGIHNMFDLTTRVPRGLVLLVKSCTNKHKAGKDCRQEEKGMTEDKTVRWHHKFSRHELEQTPGNSEGQGSLDCCSPWSRKE